MLKSNRHETKPFGALSLIGREEEKEEEKEKEEEEETLMSVSLHALFVSPSLGSDSPAKGRSRVRS